MAGDASAAQVLFLSLLKFYLFYLFPPLYYILLLYFVQYRFCSTVHCRGHVTHVAQAVVPEEQGAYQQHSAWGCSQHHL